MTVRLTEIEVLRTRVSQSPNEMFKKGDLPTFHKVTIVLKLFFFI